MRVLRADRWHRVASLIAIVAALGVGIVATAPAASAADVVNRPEPESARAAVGCLGAIACSATNCFAVGGYTFPNTQNRTLIQRWNGWTNMTSPFPANATGEPLGCCLRERDELFRGRELQPKRGNVSRLDPTVERHRLVDRCEPDHSRVDRRLACRSVVRDRANCFAVGSFDTAGVTKTLIERWNGAVWSVVGSPNPAGENTAFLNDVECAARRAVSP